MSENLDARVARLEEQVHELANPADGFVVVMTTTPDDPRIAPLIAAARAEGRHVVAPWTEDSDGNLIDHEDEAHQGSFARDDAAAIQL